jgi:hypothetical protein
MIPSGFFRSNILWKSKAKKTNHPGGIRSDTSPPWRFELKSSEYGTRARGMVIGLPPESNGETARHPNLGRGTRALKPFFCKVIRLRVPIFDIVTIPEVSRFPLGKEGGDQVPVHLHQIHSIRIVIGQVRVSVVDIFLTVVRDWVDHIRNAFHF